jgi:hypothetical protein
MEGGEAEVEAEGGFHNATIAINFMASNRILKIRVRKVVRPPMAG